MEIEIEKMERLAEQLVEEKGFLKVVKPKLDADKTGNKFQGRKRLMGAAKVLSINADNNSSPRQVRGKIQILTAIVPKNGLRGLL